MQNYNRSSIMSAKEILVRSLQTYGNRFGVFFIPFMITSLTKSILWKFAFVIIPQYQIRPGFTEKILMQLINYLTLTIPIISIFILISWIIDIIPDALTIKYISDMLEKRPPHLISSAKLVASKALSLISTGIIRGLLIILGFILFILPGVIMAVIFSLAIQVIIIERLGTFQSLRRSKSLASRNPWRTFSILTFTFVLTVFAGVIGETVSSHIMVMKDYIRFIAIGIAIAVARPLQPIALTYLYYSLSVEDRLTVIQKPYLPNLPLPRSPELEIRRVTSYYPKYCYKCGQKLPTDAIYCPRCGVKVRNGSPPILQNYRV